MNCMLMRPINSRPMRARGLAGSEVQRPEKMLCCLKKGEPSPDEACKINPKTKSCNKKKNYDASSSCRYPHEVTFVNPIGYGCASDSFSPSSSMILGSTCDALPSKKYCVTAEVNGVGLTLISTTAAPREAA